MMDTRTAAQAMAGMLHGQNAWFDSVTTDSRTAQAGALFVALSGERFDGHDYVTRALERGAVAAVVAADRIGTPGVDLPNAVLLAVDDPLRALGDLAATWRRRFTLPVVSIAGSNGKTTVKEMTAAILRVAHGERHVLATSGNLNNAIGLPLTVLGLRAMHSAAVIEIGMNHSGETARLAAIAQATIGVINNAQREHQEFMKSVADVAAEHAALINALPERGVAVVNGDDDYGPFWHEVIVRRNAEGASIALRDFGMRAAASVTARYRGETWGAHVDVTTPEGSIGFDLRALGRHSVANALAAIAAATAAGATLSDAAEALSAFRPLSGRLRAIELADEAVVIDDTYNANPDSVRAAIAVLARAASPRWLVLGDMGEVGEQGVTFHREVGAYARAAGVDRLYAAGDLAQHAVAAFGEGGEHFASVDELILALRPVPGRTLLVKGSRFMKMERVVQALTGTAMAAH
ncbi:MAG: UDP-N-acetylmuramoyl-tripeptide--D-alanyl-D-alanine ligase [Betaproteobacteria bacterium]